jgi:hypothetical protein
MNEESAEQVPASEPPKQSAADATRGLRPWVIVLVAASLVVAAGAGLWWYRYVNSPQRSLDRKATGTA